MRRVRHGAYQVAAGADLGLEVELHALGGHERLKTVAHRCPIQRVDEPRRPSHAHDVPAGEVAADRPRERTRRPGSSPASPSCPSGPSGHRRSRRSRSPGASATPAATSRSTPATPLPRPSGPAPAEVGSITLLELGARSTRRPDPSGPRAAVQEGVEVRNTCARRHRTAFPAVRRGRRRAGPCTASRSAGRPVPRTRRRARAAGQRAARGWAGHSPPPIRRRPVRRAPAARRWRTTRTITPLSPARTPRSSRSPAPGARERWEPEHLLGRAQQRVVVEARRHSGAPGARRVRRPAWGCAARRGRRPRPR